MNRYRVEHRLSQALKKLLSKIRLRISFHLNLFKYESINILWWWLLDILHSLNLWLTLKLFVRDGLNSVSILKPLLNDIWNSLQVIYRQILLYYFTNSKCILNFSISWLWSLIHPWIDEQILPDFLLLQSTFLQLPNFFIRKVRIFDSNDNWSQHYTKFKCCYLNPSDMTFWKTDPKYQS